MALWVWPRVAAHQPLVWFVAQLVPVLAGEELCCKRTEMLGRPWPSGDSAKMGLGARKAWCFSH